MKKFTNMSRELAAITFSDNSSQFLKSGQSLETNKEVKRLDGNIKVKDIETAKRRKTRTPTTTEDNKEV